MSPGKHYRRGGRWLEIIIIFTVAVLAVGGGLAGYLIGKGNKEGSGKTATKSSSASDSSSSSMKPIYVPGFVDPIPAGKNAIDGWELSLVTSKKKFRRGETIDFKLTIKNSSTEDRTLTFNSVQKYDIEARDADGNKVWQWSADQVFAQMLSQETLKPGESRDFSVFWSQLSTQKKQVLLGKYYILGYVTASEVSMEKVALELEIAEE